MSIQTEAADSLLDFFKRSVANKSTLVLPRDFVVSSDSMSNELRGFRPYKPDDQVNHQNQALNAPPPTVTSVTRPYGTLHGGVMVTINGTNFSNSGGTPDITFDSNLATSVTFVNSTTLTCVTPPGAVGAVDVEVFNPDGRSGVGTNLYTYQAFPTAFTFTGLPGSPPSILCSTNYSCTLTATGNFTGSIRIINYVPAFATVFAFGGGIVCSGVPNDHFPTNIFMDNGVVTFTFRVDACAVPNYGGGGFATGTIDMAMTDPFNFAATPTINGLSFESITLN